MTYPHRQRTPGFPLCLCGAMPGTGPTSTWGADCPAAMRDHIATLTATLRDLRAQLDHIAHVGWDASCGSAAGDVLGSEDATRLNRYAVRVARERDEARAQLATTRRTLSALDCRYAGGGVADVSGSHCPLGAPCERCAGERVREEARAAALHEAANTAFDAVFQGHTTSEEAMRVLNTALAAIRALATAAHESGPARVCDVEGDL